MPEPFPLKEPEAVIEENTDKEDGEGDEDDE